MKRRTLMKTVGGIGALGTVGGFALTGNAAAEVQTGMFGVQQDYDIDTESGLLESLTLKDISVIAEWDNFDNYVQKVSWQLDVEYDGNRETAVRTAHMNADDGDFDKVFSGKVTDGMDDLNLLGSDTPWTAEDFEVESESLYDKKDVTEIFPLTFYLVCQVADVEGNQLEVRVRGGTDLGITNLGADARTGGNGTITHENSTAPNQTPSPLTNIPPVETDSPSKGQYNALENASLTDPFTVRVEDSDRSGQTGEVQVTAYYDSFGNAPSDTLGPSPKEPDFNSNGVAEFTIGSAGTGADLETGIAPGGVGTDATLINQISIDKKPDSIAVETQ